MIALRAACVFDGTTLLSDPVGTAGFSAARWKERTRSVLRFASPIELAAAVDEAHRLGLPMVTLAGLSPLDALRSATSEAARVCRIGDPLADITAIRNVIAVFRSGIRVADS